MITKAIVDSVVDKYTIKVRIPRLDRIPISSNHTASRLLNEAVICTLNNCHPNLRPGDIVFVALDDENEDEAIILGYLYRQKQTESYCDLIMGELTVLNQVTLPKETTIGEIKYSNLNSLLGINGNIQGQLSSLQEQIIELSRIKELLAEKVNDLTLRIEQLENKE